MSFRAEQADVFLRSVPAERRPAQSRYSAPSSGFCSMNLSVFSLGSLCSDLCDLCVEAGLFLRTVSRRLPAKNSQLFLLANKNGRQRAEAAGQFTSFFRDLYAPFFETLAAWGPLGP